MQLARACPRFFSLVTALALASACNDPTATTTETSPTSTGDTEAPNTQTSEPTTVAPDPTSTTSDVETGTSTVEPGTSTIEPGTSTIEPGTSTIEPGTSTIEPGTSTIEPETTTAETDTMTGTTGPIDCTPGEIGCACADESCVEGAVCILPYLECVPFTGLCPYELDGECDEGTFCDPATDPFDCCATPQNDVCEELSAGGECAKASDYFDCGHCPFTDNGQCDEGICPEGTDVNDCCATQQDGVCEEMSQGGMCPDGTDSYDCGFCMWQNDGECDEPDLCPPNSDGDDCCATPENGVCEEIDQGGECPQGSDSVDCGECPFANDGVCDEPFDCAPGTDDADCCATIGDGVCEEMSQGGACDDQTDWVDCGYCPFTDDFTCDEPDLCSEGTDTADCCATKFDGVCEEVDQGGDCEDGTDWFDCGECPAMWLGDGECDEPELCPPGSDVEDCG